ncbi:carboxypeptidase-like regulatory domain-containing protein [Niabella sp. W65]|nr:carboxypeptidase-like regulatory domain-containing protein [Niabella sp. W65]MCH7362298.1 carboxypeptidase-like regulatory domain-containing protein [Niabella sp. W65]ULT38276.1 carboxypeptidase-like regulatory domain-containing protein [Niabella sp. I65]
MIKWITLLFCMSMSMMLCAQVTIHGTVKNQSGAPLVNASIIISPVGSSKVIAFKMTDGKGAFTIPLQSGLDSVQVKLNLLNHETEIKTIVNQTQEIHFIAKEKATVLEEVFVKDPMMFRKGDTIVHDVEQFANKNDRTLADVIKRMPGLEIDESGKIKYQEKM